MAKRKNASVNICDVELTTRLRDAGRLLGVTVLDHIITGDNGDYFSFAGADML